MNETALVDFRGSRSDGEIAQIPGVQINRDRFFGARHTGVQCLFGEKRLLAIEENRKTNDRLRRAGFDVRTFPGSEICINGSGGPTCLTRPLLRA